MSARDLIARACCHDPDECVMGTGSISTAGTSSFKCYQRAWEQQLPRANAILSALTAAGYRLIGPDDAKLIQTALEHASFALDGIVALDDEDMGKDGGSATAQHTKRTVDRALEALRALQSQEAGNEG